MRPDELFGDCVFGHSSKLSKEGSVFELDVQAICEANIVFALKFKLVNVERKGNLAAAVLRARNRSVSNLLSEPKPHKALFNFLLFRHQFCQVHLCA